MDAYITPKEIIYSIPKYFVPDTGRKRKLTLVYKIEGDDPGAGSWTVIADNESCSVAEGEAEIFDSKILLSGADYLRLVSGETDVKTLWDTCRMRVIGKIFTLAELNGFMKLPEDKSIVHI